MTSHYKRSRKKPVNIEDLNKMINKLGKMFPTTAEYTLLHTQHIIFLKKLQNWALKLILANAEIYIIIKYVASAKGLGTGW